MPRCIRKSIGSVANNRGFRSALTPLMTAPMRFLLSSRSSCLGCCMCGRTCGRLAELSLKRFPRSQIKHRSHDGAALRFRNQESDWLPHQVISGVAEEFAGARVGLRNRTLIVDQ